jgi:hypothetical protein
MLVAVGEHCRLGSEKSPILDKTSRCGADSFMGKMVVLRVLFAGAGIAVVGFGAINAVEPI